MNHIARTLIPILTALSLHISHPAPVVEAHPAPVAEVFSSEPIPAVAASVEIAAPEYVDEPELDAPGIYGATQEQRRVIEKAIARYAEAALPLPDLRIYVHQDREPCHGYLALFNKDYSGHRIDLCEDGSLIVLHELAHAWEHHHVSDATRAAFLEQIGRTVWNHKDTLHEERGIEAAARIVAWGLKDDALTAGQAAEYREQLDRYHNLTGSYSPRYPHPPPQAPVASTTDDAATAAALSALAAAANNS